MLGFTASTSWYSPFFVLFDSDLCFVVARRKKSFRDAMQNEDRWRKCAEKGQANCVVSEAKGDDREYERDQEPQSNKAEKKPLFRVVDHDITYLA